MMLLQHLALILVLVKSQFMITSNHNLVTMRKSFWNKRISLIYFKETWKQRYLTQFLIELGQIGRISVRGDIARVDEHVPVGNHVSRKNYCYDSTHLSVHSSGLFLSWWTIRLFMHTALLQVRECGTPNEGNIASSSWTHSARSSSSTRSACPISWQWWGREWREARLLLCNGHIFCLDRYILLSV